MKFDFPFNLNYEWDSDGPSSIVIYLDDKYGSPWPIDKDNSSLFRFKVNTRILLLISPRIKKTY